MWETIRPRLSLAGAHAQVSVHSWRLVLPLCVSAMHLKAKAKKKDP